MCDRLRESLPDLIPKSEKDLLRLLYTVSHVEQHPASDTRRSHPGRWSGDDLLRAASQLRSILERETQWHVSLPSFKGQYLPVIHFPADVINALESGDINLQEAAQLARLMAYRLGRSVQAARARRSELLGSHLAVQGRSRDPSSPACDNYSVTCPQRRSPPYR